LSKAGERIDTNDLGAVLTVLGKLPSGFPNGSASASQSSYQDSRAHEQRRLAEISLNRWRQNSDPLSLESAGRHVQEAAKLSELVGDRASQAINLFEFSRTKLLQGRPGEAIPILDSALAIYEQKDPTDRRFLVTLGAVQKAILDRAISRSREDHKALISRLHPLRQLCLSGFFFGEDDRLTGLKLTRLDSLQGKGSWRPPIISRWVLGT
jgi:hypothetical protein